MLAGILSTRLLMRTSQDFTEASRHKRLVAALFELKMKQTYKKCKATLKTKQAYESHMENCHCTTVNVSYLNDLDKKVQKVIVRDTASDYLKCPECPYTIYNASTLRPHLSGGIHIDNIDDYKEDVTNMANKLALKEISIQLAYKDKSSWRVASLTLVTIIVVLLIIIIMLIYHSV